ncbi:MAG: proton-conducting transporter membrane subunit [Eubacteriales bacterium]|nr:proton-conducting transporter membrane subunit [Eubacteriales bacterium]
MLPVALLTPFLGGGLIFALRLQSRRARNILCFLFTLATSVLTAWCVLAEGDAAFTLLRLSDKLTVSFHMDGLGRVFSGMIAFLWPLATLYAFEYMSHEGEENGFFGFYLTSYGVTLGVATAANLLTMYVFFELLTLSTLFLVTHGMRSRSVAAGRQYVYYSLGGAALGFVALAGVLWYGGTTDFSYGGIAALAGAPMTVLCVLMVLGFFGFGVKSAVFPLHGWLPTASIAPTPVTALLHAVAVVKAGAFAVMRLLYYTLGADLMRGTWAQTVCVLAAALTIVYGSAMAVREQHMKRRLAYSTVSNLSYVLFGAALLTPAGLTGSLMHMVYHALMKITLFSCVGAVMVQTGKQYVPEYRGLARRMPFIMAVFAFCAIELVGIPPFVGFQSKWALAEAGLASGTWAGTVGVIALIVSAILTSIYMLVPSVTAWFPPKDGEAALPVSSDDPGWEMKAPLAILCAVMLYLAFGSAPLGSLLANVAGGLM